ncbi:uncharacterized protein LOC143183022 [Calliopsis andreniformis]|uniref:uncharacterized protein LOC143183022 n=1 Tax=Calliopsis andreniformis TaxID=337506 RepID=UPI003FCD1CD5
MVKIDSIAGYGTIMELNLPFPQFLALVICSFACVLSENTESNNQLLARASAQLERLAPYRRTSTDQVAPEDQTQLPENATKEPETKQQLDDRQMAFEIYRMLPASVQKDIARRVGGNEAVVELLTNPKYFALMQARIKRSGSKGGQGTKRDGYTYDGYEGPPEGHPPSGYGGYAPEYGGGEHYAPHPPAGGSDSGGIIKGSTSLISGIAKGIIGGLVSASGTASKGSSSMSASASGMSSSSSSSSSHPQPEYGPAYSYHDQAFDVWDFKKAIISTLMQAVKAISGGVIALKGQIIKGSGYLISSKGKMIISTGDAITSLGRNIAKSTVQHQEPHHHGYTYDHPPEHGHDSYEGPPPGIEEEFSGPGGEYHGSANHESPSDVDDEAGLLIVKPTKPDDHDNHSGLDSRKPPTEDSYDGPPPTVHDKEVENSVAGNPNGVAETHRPSDHPQSSYDAPLQHHSLDDHKNGQDYAAYPPLASVLPLSHHNPLSIQQSVEYPPIHIRYTVPDKGSLDLPLEDASDNDLSMYSSLSIKPGPDIETIKISAMNHFGGFDLPKLQTHGNFHSLPSLPSAYAGPALQGPLKIPLLNPYTLSPHWHNQGLLQPIPGFDMHGFYRRKSSVQRKRSVNDVARRMRLLHRV